MVKPSILIVEDDRAVRNLLTTALETWGYAFHTAETGQPL
jgi:two-component system KDP operon response regulator KdpE